MNALSGTNEIDLTVTGRASGRSITNPVWFVQEGEKLYLVPVRGADSDWYRNVQKTPTVRLEAAGTAWAGQSAPITDAAAVHEVVEKFRAKYGAGEVQRYYAKPDVAVEVSLA
jgi:deazaflavin-dependent oxidoreductase (nitroreductase family)